MLKADERATILDINPRFTGAHPFYHLAGANAPAAIVAWVMGQDVEPAWLQMASEVRGVKEFETLQIETRLEYQ